ncbi:MAG: ATP-binding protein [Candidatus Izemoplasmatales bacterium]
MDDLSLFVLDIVQNAIVAEAEDIAVAIREDSSQDTLVLTVVDDGRGMDPMTVERAVDPFFTTRTTRKVGLGLPFLMMAAELADGSFAIESDPGVGTVVEARFVRSHVNTPPLGDMAESLYTICLHQNVREFRYAHVCDGRRFDFSLGEIRTILDGVPLTAAGIGAYLKSYIKEHIITTRGEYR